MAKALLATALAHELLGERAEHTHLMARIWARDFINAGREPSKWHASISLRGIVLAYKDHVARSAGGIAGDQLAARIQHSQHSYVALATYDERKGVIYVKLTHEALVAACMECATATALKLSVPMTELFQARVLKWIDADVPSNRATAYRSALSANVVASASAELASIVGLPDRPHCVEIRRGQCELPADAAELRRYGTTVFGRAFASMHMPKLFTALRNLGHLRHDPAPGVLSLVMALPDPKQDTPVVLADENGVVTALAADACVLYMLMAERLAEIAAAGVGASQDQAETWYHYVPNSRQCLHWQSAIGVAELACQSPAHLIKNTLCYVGDAVVSESVARDRSGQTFQLLDSLGLFGNPTVDVQDMSEAESADRDVLQTALHYGMMATAGKNKHAVKSLEGPTEGSFLQYNHARLSRISAPYPNAQVPHYWSMVDPELIKGAETELVAYLVSQLPDMLYTCVSTHRPEIASAYFNRLAHAVSRAIMHIRVKDMEPKVAESRA
ncbi:High affinity Ca2+/Mn2+ P-type ATPase-like protein, partial [Dipsacomyces acuminosporus]